MLATLADHPVEFPHVGSFADFGGKRFRIAERLPTGEAIITDPSDSSVTARRRVPVSELRNPDLVAIDTDGLDPVAVRALSWLSVQLRGANMVIFEEIKTQLYIAAQTGTGGMVDGKTLAGLMRRLGWAREKVDWRHGERITTWHRLKPELVG